MRQGEIGEQMVDVNPTSQRWREICEITDEDSQNRALRRYVYELERKVHFYESELKTFREENKQVRKDILSMKIVQDAIKKAEHEEFSRCNTDWSGLQCGF